MQYYNCKVYKKLLVNEKMTFNHKIQAGVMKKKYLKLKGWHYIRF